MIYVILFGVLVLVIIMINAAKRQSTGAKGSAPKRSRRSAKAVSFDASKLPANLGLLSSVPLERSVKRLEDALSPYFVEQLQIRVLTNHPDMTKDEFDCLFFELKRFFLINLILKKTPMFSEKVDHVWHEMLMFTREYQKFGESFAGGIVHHSPESEPKQMPGERAWFDWIYAHLFEFTPFSSQIWQGFFRYPLDKERIELLQTGDSRMLAESWFQTSQAEKYPEVKQTIQLLINQAKQQIIHAAESSNYKGTQWYGQSGTQNLTYLAASMVFFSLMDDSLYNSHMEPLLPEEEISSRRESSSCSTSGCGSAGDDRNSSSDGDSSGGSSSCSSGSSCGSGCGGGGD